MAIAVLAEHLDCAFLEAHPRIVAF